MATSDSMVDGPPTKKAKMGGDVGLHSAIHAGIHNIFVQKVGKLGIVGYRTNR